MTRKDDKRAGHWRGGWIIRRENRRTLTGRECKKGRMEGTDERREEEKKDEGEGTSERRRGNIRTKRRGKKDEGEGDIRTEANRQKK